MPLIYAPRLRSFDYVGCHRYFLTICTFDRAKVFVDDSTARMVIEQLSRTSEGEHEAADLRECVRLFKQKTSFAWKRQHATQLWQRGYIDHVLREEEDTFAVARYIIENPLRADLVSNPLDYPYLGSLTVSVRDLLYSVQIDQRR